MVKRYTITVEDDLDRMLDKIEGMGNARATVIINIVRSWLAEKSMISTQAKTKIK